MNYIQKEFNCINPLNSSAEGMEPVMSQFAIEQEVIKCEYT